MPNLKHKLEIIQSTQDLQLPHSLIYAQKPIVKSILSV